MTETVTKISYLRDSVNPDRVMTLVSKRTGNDIVYQFTLNTPTEWILGVERADTKVLHKRLGDKFSKAKGRTIAFGRLEKHPIPITAAEGEATNIAILKDLLTSENKFCRRIAKDEIYYHNWVTQLATLQAEMSELSAGKPIC